MNGLFKSSPYKPYYRAEVCEDIIVPLLNSQAAAAFSYCSEVFRVHNVLNKACRSFWDHAFSL